MARHTHIVVLAGPNGAGKSTCAPSLLRGRLAVEEFVNADTIARGLSAFAPERAAVAAGRVMLQRLDWLAGLGRSFAFETTLASRTLRPRLERLIAGGYRIHLIFLWLPNDDFAVARVRERVRLGGHGVPEETVRRRYARGVENFLQVYRAIATTWRFYDNSGPRPRLVARGGAAHGERVLDKAIWERLTLK